MYIENAYKGENDAWRYVVTIIIVIFAYLAGNIPIFYVAAMYAIDVHGSIQFIDPLGLADYPNLFFILVLFPFLTSFLALVICVQALHKRSFLTVFSFIDRIRWRRLFFGLGVWLVLMLLAELVFYLLKPELYTFNFNAALFLPLLVIALLFLPFQAAFEEIFLRGYLLQGIGSGIKVKWAAIIITSAAFALLHGSNPEIAKYGFWNMMPYYFVFGAVMAAIAILDGGIEIPIGMHIATNVYGALLVTYPDSALPTPALFRIEEVNLTTMYIGATVFTVIFILIASKVYNWQWNDLNTPVAKSLTENPENFNNNTHY